MSEKKPNSRKVKVNKVTSNTKSVFQQWWEYSRIKEDDSLGRKFYKVFIRIVGIITIIIFSPAIAIVLLFAFLAAF